MTHETRSSRFPKTALALATCAAITSVHAQQLEEVMVTAQKRAESLQDVPISVNAVSGELINNSGMNNLQQVAQLVPNLHIGDAPGNKSIMMRGVGSGPGNRSFEQSVGLYIDGIFSGRAPLFQVPFLDVDRVEVLRGAQGVLFGKNSIAGAVSVHTARPDDAFYGEISAQYGFEYDQRSVTGIISGAITDKLFGRAVITTTDADGWQDNASNGKDTPATDTDAYRINLVWEPTDTTSLFFKAEHNELTVDGPGFQSEAESGSLAGNFVAMPFDELLDVVANPASPAEALAANQVLQMRIGDEDFKWNDRLTADRVDVGVEQDTEAYTLEVKQVVGELEFTYLGGYAEYDRLEKMDNDFSAADFVALTNNEDYSQISHEFRISSPGGETLDYIAGLYYLDRNFDLPITDSYVNAGPLAHYGHGVYEENTEAWSIFAQLTWNITDTFRATLGARYSDEDKTASKTYFLSDIGGDIPLQESNPLAYTIITALLPFNDFNFSDERNETNLDPALNIQWDFSDSSMAYLSLTEATKGGGFNSSVLGGDGSSNWEYEEETATSIEIGLKSEFADGRGRANLAAFYTRFDDLQVSTWVASESAFVTGNAAEATSYGFELESMYAVSDKLTLGANLAYLSAEYDEFLAGCPGSDAQWQGRGDCAETAGNSGVDMSGETLANAPEWSGLFYADYSGSLTDNIDFSTRLDVTFSDEYRVDVHDVPLLTQDSFYRANARFALDAADYRWTVALNLLNLNDERVLTGGGDHFALPGMYWKNRTMGREVQLQATYRFF